MSATWSCLAWCSVTCCARRTPMRAFARSTRKAKAAPGVLAVLTGEDWQASGWGDLPVPGGLKRRDGSVVPAAVSGAGQGPCALGRRLRRLRGGGDLSPGAGRGRADRRRLRAAARHRLDRGARAPTARRGSGTIVPDNIGFVQIVRRQGRDRGGVAKADHVIKHRFVINRVTAASMEPRGCLGDYNAAEDRYTIYTTLQRAHPFRAELAPVLQGAGEPRSAWSPATSAAASA